MTHEEIRLAVLAVAGLVFVATEWQAIAAILRGQSPE